jgi:hypothetical protein
VAEIGKWPTADKANITSLENWHYNNKGVIEKREKEYISQKDVFALFPRSMEPLRRFLEHWDAFVLSPLWRKTPDPSLPSYERQRVLYMEDGKIDVFITLVLSLICLTMLIAPLWILNFIDPVLVKLGVITAFIVVFFIALVTNAKPSDTLVATAG